MKWPFKKKKKLEIVTQIVMASLKRGEKAIFILPDQCDQETIERFAAKLKTERIIVTNFPVKLKKIKI